MLRVLVIIVVFATSLPASAAGSRSTCANRDSIVAKLRTDYKEIPDGRGHTSEGGVLEIFTSTAGSWTILVTSPGVAGNLISCLVAHGESWEALPQGFVKDGRSS